MKNRFTIVFIALLFCGALNGAERSRADCIKLAVQVRKELDEAIRIELRRVDIAGLKSFVLVFDHEMTVQYDAEKLKAFSAKAAEYKDALEQCNNSCEEHYQITFALSALRKFELTRDLVEKDIEKHENNGQGSAAEQQ